MKKLIKRILYSSLGEKKYLRLLNRGFFFAYSLGLLKQNEAYQYNYFVKHLINKGDYVLDLGANLGYFSKIFARLVGASGKVICVEPVRPFFQVLKKCTRNKPNVMLYNYALGTENKTIKMIVPKMDGYLRTGLAHIPRQTDNVVDNQYEFCVEMVRGSELLKGISKLDYIKCDIEGYEEIVFPEIKKLIARYKPTIQVETWGDHRAKVFDLLQSLGYTSYALIDKKLTRQFDINQYGGDFVFVHTSRQQNLVAKLQREKAIVVS